MRSQLFFKVLFFIVMASLLINYLKCHSRNYHNRRKAFVPPARAGSLNMLSNLTRSIANYPFSNACLIPLLDIAWSITLSNDASQIVTCHDIKKIFKNLVLFALSLHSQVTDPHACGNRASITLSKCFSRISPSNLNKTFSAPRRIIPTISVFITHLK